MNKLTLIGPFTQLIPMTGLPLKGALAEDQILVYEKAGLLINNGRIEGLGNFQEMYKIAKDSKYEVIALEEDAIGLPGLIDAHTHICFAGSRASDYAMRNAGKSYLEIAKAGGGIWDTVTETRKANQEWLTSAIIKRTKQHIKSGVTTMEVKSGYGLTVEEELKMLRAIKEADNAQPIDLISTCLAAHMLPRDYNGSQEAYLKEISSVLFPKLLGDQLTNRIDAFIEESAFSKETIGPYFDKANKMGFNITVHADQFTTGGSAVAVQYGAVSADHLEASTDKEITLLANSQVIATALPGASLGLGCAFTPARKILDAGGALAIASDHNPGSAPMGDLLTQASILGTFQKLTTAEVLAGITFRAAAALSLKDRGKLEKGYLADFCIFPTNHYNEILYHQGSLKPSMVWKRGRCIYDSKKIPTNYPSP